MAMRFSAWLVVAALTTAYDLGPFGQKAIASSWESAVIDHCLKQDGDNLNDVTGLANFVTVLIPGSSFASRVIADALSPLTWSAQLMAELGTIYLEYVAESHPVAYSVIAPLRRSITKAAYLLIPETIRSQIAHFSFILGNENAIRITDLYRACGVQLKSRSSS